MWTYYYYLYKNGFLFLLIVSNSLHSPQPLKINITIYKYNTVNIVYLQIHNKLSKKVLSSLIEERNQFINNESLMYRT